MQSLSLDISSLRPWIAVSFTRSSGPGGQNVNKVSTRVTLLFDFENCPIIPDAHKARIRKQLASRLSCDGRLRVASQRERTQWRNRVAAENKLIGLLDRATRIRQRRKPTRPTAGSVRRRLAEKRHRGALKQQRQGHERHRED